jgi:hypothetical protein
VDATITVDVHTANLPRRESLLLAICFCFGSFQILVLVAPSKLHIGWLGQNFTLQDDVAGNAEVLKVSALERQELTNSETGGPSNWIRFKLAVSACSSLGEAEGAWNHPVDVVGRFFDLKSKRLDCAFRTGQRQETKCG